MNFSGEFEQIISDQLILFDSLICVSDFNINMLDLQTSHTQRQRVVQSQTVGG